MQVPGLTIERPRHMCKENPNSFTPPRLLACQERDDLPFNLAALIRPLLDFDFLGLTVFKEGSSEVLWHWNTVLSASFRYIPQVNRSECLALRTGGRPQSGERSSS
jgi:hypothetical protein